MSSVRRVRLSAIILLAVAVENTNLLATEEACMVVTSVAAFARVENIS